MIAEVVEREAAARKVALAAQANPESPAPATTAVPKKKDPVMARLFADLGQVIGDDGNLAPIAATVPEKVDPTKEPAFTMGMNVADVAVEAQRRSKEKQDKEAAEAEKSKTEDPKAAVTDSTGPDGKPLSKADEPAKVEGTPDTAPASAEPAQKVEVQTVKPLEKIVKETVERAFEARQQTKREPEVPAKVETTGVDAAFEAGLLDIQREELELARYAAQKNPQRFGDLPTKIVGYYKAADQEYERLKKDNAEFSEDSDEWKSFVAENRPDGLSYSERNRMIEDRAQEKVLSKTQEMIKERDEKYEREIHLLKNRPAVEKSVDEFQKELVDVLAAGGENAPAADIALRAKEVGWDKAVAEDPVEGAEIMRVRKNAEVLGRTYMEIVTGLAPFDPAIPEHSAVLDFVNQDGERFSQTGGEERVRTADGMKRTYLPRGEYLTLASQDPAKARSHWTFDHHEILNRLALSAAQTANYLVKQRRDELAASGYKKEKQKASASVQAKPATTTTKVEPQAASPKTSMSVSPGPAKSAGIMGTKGMSDREIAVLVPGWKPS